MNLRPISLMIVVALFNITVSVTELHIKYFIDISCEHGYSPADDFVGAQQIKPPEQDFTSRIIIKQLASPHRLVSTNWVWYFKIWNPANIVGKISVNNGPFKVIAPEMSLDYIANNILSEYLKVGYNRKGSIASKEELFKRLYIEPLPLQPQQSIILDDAGTGVLTALGFADGGIPDPLAIVMCGVNKDGTGGIEKTFDSNDDLEGIVPCHKITLKQANQDRVITFKTRKDSKKGNNSDAY